MSLLIFALLLYDDPGIHRLQYTFMMQEFYLYKEIIL